ncbi:MAG: hypothetical protein QM831_15310 [Kofleriaceae bacterium]
MLHILVVAAMVHWLNRDKEVELVDIELAPQAPKVEALPEETAKQEDQAQPDQVAAADQAQQEAAAAADKAAPGEEGAGLALDAGVDAPVDAATKIARAVDAGTVAQVVDAGMDGAAIASLTGTGSDGSGTGSGSGSGSGLGSDATGSDALAMGSNGSAGSNGSNAIALGSNGSAGSNGSMGSNATGSNALGSNAVASNAGSNAIASNAGSNGGATGSNAIAAGGSAAIATGTGLNGAGSGIASGSGSGPGVAGAFTTSTGSGVAGMDDQPGVDGAPTSAGTAANLLAYFPPGHTISVLVRFDRLRGSEWAASAENLFHPMPDYQSLFGTKTAGITDKLDMLVISTPRPREVTATTLVMQTHLSRAETRDLLANADTPVAWSTVRGGALGKRSGKVFPNDKRVILSPWKGWYVLAQPEDLAGATTAKTGSIDTIEAKTGLPPWLNGIRSITKESGGDDKKGPALVMTIGEPPSTTKPGQTGRYKLPELGLGVHSLPVPQRISLAMELVKQGWLIRGNISFGNEKDATELVTTLEDLKTRITDSHILSALLKKQHLLNVVTGLTLARSGSRISYATSISIADARAILNAASQALGGYFGQPAP